MTSHAPQWWQRLSVRIYLAMLASMAVCGGLFAVAWVVWHTYRVSGHRVSNLVVVIIVFLALALAVGAFPIVRRLTGRLERLQRSVDALGSGQLSTRVAVEGRDEVASLAGSFNRSAARIEALVAAQKTLLANASHELRSPLARIRMAIELMREQAPPDVHRELARNIAELDQLVDEILLASRLDAVPGSSLKLESVDLTALVAEECAALDAQLEAQRVVLCGDSSLLRRMLRNLLENARRHGDGAPILVRLAIDADQCIRLDVTDQGPGIAEAERENVFAPFYRLPGSSERTGGVGLGLSLVRQIATAHGGSVQCLPMEPSGSCFRVTLHVAPPVAE
jgi:two-component system OmpR family sensor kinase